MGILFQRYDTDFADTLLYYQHGPRQLCHLPTSLRGIPSLPASTCSPSRRAESVYHNDTRHGETFRVHCTMNGFARPSQSVKHSILGRRSRSGPVRAQRLRNEMPRTFLERPTALLTKRQTLCQPMLRSIALLDRPLQTRPPVDSVAKCALSATPSPSPEQ